VIPNRGRRCSLSLFRQNRLGEGYSEIKPPSPRCEVGSRPIPQTVESLLITETKDTMLNIPHDCGYQVVGNTMRSSESLQRRMQSHHTPDYFFRHPKRTTYIGAWNVRSLIDVGKAAQVAREMEMNRCEILGLSEMSWGGF